MLNTWNLEAYDWNTITATAPCYGTLLPLPPYEF